MVQCCHSAGWMAATMPVPFAIGLEDTPRRIMAEVPQSQEDTSPLCRTGSANNHFLHGLARDLLDLSRKLAHGLA